MHERKPEDRFAVNVILTAHQIAAAGGAIQYVVDALSKAAVAERGSAKESHPTLPLLNAVLALLDLAGQRVERVIRRAGAECVDPEDLDVEDLGEEDQEISRLWSNLEMLRSRWRMLEATGNVLRADQDVAELMAVTADVLGAYESLRPPDEEEDEEK